MKRRADWDDDYWYAPSLGMGSVHDLSDSKPGGRTQAVLWIPDPEQRHKWREYYVVGDPPKDEREPMGFKPNGKGNDR